MSIENTSIARDNTIRTSQLKLANIARLIVNQRVNKAIEQLKFSNKRVSQNVLKVLNSAIANAENNKQLDIDNLYVKEAFVGKSLSMKRFRPRAKGRASSILKPFSKLTIILEERINKNKENKSKWDKKLIQTA
jgi:large subunit ribosomal protein L22